MSFLNHMRRREFLVGIGATTATLAFSTLFSPRRALALNPVTRLVPSQYSTIQSAIDACDNGDQILVSPGTYFETLDFKGRLIALKSLAGPANTVIDASKVSGIVPTVYLGSAEPLGTVLDGFYIRGGRGYGGGSNKSGGGIFLQDTDVTISNCIIAENQANFGAGIAVYGGTPLIHSSLIQNNTALGSNTSGTGGTGVHLTNSYGTLLNCRVHANLAAGYQRGAIYTRSAAPMVIGCEISSNTSTSGSALYVSAAATTVANSTFAANSATTGTGGIYASGSLPVKFYNSIVWGNTGPSSAQVILSPSTPLDAAHCTVQGGIAGYSQYIYDVDPAFIDFAGGNLRLQSQSPAINLGSSALVPTFHTTDLDGNTRIVGSAVDLGAYESQGASSQCVGDTNSDNQVDNQDLTTVLNDWGSSSSPADVNGDGIVGNVDLINVLNNWGPCE